MGLHYGRGLSNLPAVPRIPVIGLGVGKGVMTELFHRLDRQLEGGFSTVYILLGICPGLVFGRGNTRDHISHGLL